MVRETTAPTRTQSVNPKKERRRSESEESSEDEEVGEISVQEEWETSTNDVAELLDSLKENLAQIDPGIGDRITLAKFCAFIEANSSSLR
jgi:hypothetical protein